MCHAGCEVGAVVDALGLEMTDLFPEGEKPKAGKKKPRIVTTYPYVNEAGQLEYEVVRYEPKGFRQRRPDPKGKDGWSWNLNGCRRVLYRLPEVIDAIHTGTRIFLPEGEKDVDNLRAVGFRATTHAGGAKNWKPDCYVETLRGARVVVLPDGDEPGRAHGREVAQSLRGVAADVRVLNLGRQGVKDVSDWFAAGGTREQLEQLAAEAPTADALAALDGAELLDTVARFIRRFVVVTPQQAQIIALWILHTYAFEAADQTPYMAIISAEKRCGKTRLLETIGVLAREPWHAVQPSEAVLYRKIERDQPTLLLDETDALFAQKGNDRTEAVRALLNAGSRRGATVSRCLNSGEDLVDFEVYCPKALAGIGSLPETVGDRSILIEMRRKKRSETAERFRLRDVEAEAGRIREHLEAWTASRIDRLKTARPSLPPELGDRAADGAEPLLALADAAGGSWPRIAREAVVALAGERTEDDDSDGVQLLADVRRVLAQYVRTDGQLGTAKLIRWLADLDGSRWKRYGPGRDELDARDLARLLRPYSIKPKLVRPAGGEPCRGYNVADFADAFERYLADIKEDSDGSAPSVTSVTPLQPANGAGPDVTRDPLQHPLHPGKPKRTGSCTGDHAGPCNGSCNGCPVTNRSDNGAGCNGVTPVTVQVDATEDAEEVA